MAGKKMGRPKGTNNRGEGILVSVDPNVVGKAKVIVGRRNLKLGDFLSELLTKPVDREYAKVLGEMQRER